MKEVISKIYYDSNKEVTSTVYDCELIRCRNCNFAIESETNFVKLCTMWNRIVPLNGYCYLGSKRGTTDETV